MRMVTMVGQRELKGAEAEQARMTAAVSVQVSRLIEMDERRQMRLEDAPDRSSVKRAMLAVEKRIVEALWVIARLPGGGGGSCGLSYIHDESDQWASGGAIRPRPAVPSPKAIDAIHEPMDWLGWLPRELSMLVSVAAGTKRGDVDRNISWGRVRDSLPQTRAQTTRTLQRRYDGAIRQIVARLTIVSCLS